MTAVVLQELTAGAKDASAVSAWNSARREHEAANTLLVPNSEDWWIAGKVLNSLLRGSKSRKSGRIKKLGFDEKHRIVRDVLIARVAKRAGAALVTDNLGDFEKIRSFCSVKVIAGNDYFDE